MSPAADRPEVVPAFEAGRVGLLRGDVGASIAAYAKAIQSTTSPDMIDAALEALDRLAPGPDLEVAVRLLRVARAARFPGEAGADPGGRALEGVDGPVVILTGGSDERVEERMRDYRSILVEGFRDFHGLIVSGGTTTGISRLAGDLAESSGGRIRAVGYVPGSVPADSSVDADPARYREVRRTDGTDFTLLEALQGWADLVSSGVTPADVRLIGINGGEISASEYRTALAFGAAVGILRGSGRSADALFEDPDWATASNLVALAAEPDAVRGFLAAGAAGH